MDRKAYTHQLLVTGSLEITTEDKEPPYSEMRRLIADALFEDPNQIDWEKDCASSPVWLGEDEH